MHPMPLRPSVSRGNAPHVALVLAVLLGGGLALGASRPRTSESVTVCGPGDGAMAEAHAQFMAAHPALARRAATLPAGAAGTQVVTATFTASGFVFDADGNTFNGVDTVRINEGESVQWTWLSGTHDVTSGAPGDLNAGSVFFLPLGLGTPTQVFRFDTPGTYPFFCSFHSAFGMAGVVVVKAVTGVGPVPQIKAGFTSSPAPNPSHGDVSVRFAVAQGGRARLTAFDAGGRAVATLFDRDVVPGAYSAAWTGRSGAGELFAPGAYFLRLTAPGLNETRRISIVR